MIMSPKQEKEKEEGEETIPRAINIKFLKTSNKEKNPKNSQGKKKHYIQRKKEGQQIETVEARSLKVHNA